MKTLYRYIRPKLGPISLGIFVKFAGTITELVLPWMLSVILDDFVPASDIHSIVVWGVLMVVCAGFGLAANIWANQFSTRTARDITRALRHDLFAKTTNLTRAQEDAFTTPSLISRLTSDTYHVHQMVDRMQRLGVRAPILLLGGVAVSFALEPALTLVLLAIMPLLTAIVVWVSRSGVRLYTETQTALDGMLRRAQESMAGIRVIQALRKTDYETAQFDAANRDVVERERKATLLMSVTNPAMNLLLNVGLTLVIVVGAYRVNNGVTQPGTIIAFLSYFTIILTAIMMVSRLFVMYSKGAASARRIAAVLDAPDPPAPLDLPAADDDAHVRFDSVSFSYAGGGDQLTDVRFALQKGQTLGIIGPTGSGKTTLISLLLRFYDPSKGAIYISGRDIRSLPAAFLHTRFGVVFQNDFLYADTIGENIDFGRSLGADAIRQAAATAQAGFISERADGFDGEIAPKGANLSGGQKQRLLIARAIAANPEILILDDASSALDYRTDAALRRAMQWEFADTTKVIVAQRVSSIQHADWILMLDEGQVIGSGTHAQLLENCESYHEIAAIQMGEVD